MILDSQNEVYATHLVHFNEQNIFFDLHSRTVHLVQIGTSALSNLMRRYHDGLNFMIENA
jgi:hypothetical protein